MPLLHNIKQKRKNMLSGPSLHTVTFSFFANRDIQMILCCSIIHLNYVCWNLQGKQHLYRENLTNNTMSGHFFAFGNPSTHTGTEKEAKPHEQFYVFYFILFFLVSGSLWITPSFHKILHFSNNFSLFVYHQRSLRILHTSCNLSFKFSRKLCWLSQRASLWLAVVFKHLSLLEF